ncbi:MAG: hypothetical protein PHO37_02415 [Kiritimatiellae bacterium]|nr:hypothetical protein [Kiritimatiellia bacterium]
MKHVSTLYLLLFSLMINLTGCALRKAAVHPDPSGFIIRRDDDDPGIVSTRMPFMYYWQDPNYGLSERGKKFRKKERYILYVKPVGTNYLALEDKRKDFAKAVKRIADYLSKRIITEVKQYKEGSYRVLVEKDRDIANDWAKEIAQAVSARIDRDEVKKRKGFTLVPW